LTFVDLSTSGWTASAESIDALVGVVKKQGFKGVRAFFLSVRKHFGLFRTVRWFNLPIIKSQGRFYLGGKVVPSPPEI
jgi:hypothetical protein